MRLKISHTTRYSFDAPVSSGMQQLRLRPRSRRAQEVTEWKMTLEGAVHEVSYEDQHGNCVDLITFERDCTELAVHCEGEVELSESNGVIGRHTGPVPLWLYKRVTERTKAGPAIKALLKSVDAGNELGRCHALMPAIAKSVVYETGSSESDWSAEEALAAGRGVCQDHAHVMIACAREAGLAARYVSGYLMMDDRTQQQAMHAWAEVHVPDLGWVGFDPANEMCPDERYVRVAVGLDYAEAAPVNGLRSGGDTETLSVAIEVARQSQSQSQSQ
ncbi:transglutaminase-like putative cysteine protease [Sagittula marina]|uniref:Transglutaminase-like putative cysteine protease n=1 Tax=Sagittula marina TaxID=943940 RepID=A0A7W6DMZ3_9RHOB|nr:transglutaminase family protein [Sagittula marina]MBB3986136.1 transglutaminase-like putative cysteine protease [Sagittula marina]